MAKDRAPSLARPRCLAGLVACLSAAGCSERAVPVPLPALAGAPATDAGGAPDGAPAASATSCGAGEDLPPDAPWPMVGRCPDHAGRSTYPGPALPSVRWSLAVGPGGRSLDSSPVVGRGETVYLGAPDGTLRAIDGAGGAVRWSVTLEAPLGVPALGPSGALLIGGYTVAGPSWFHALDAETGRERWKYPVFEAFGPTLDGTGRVYFADAERVLVLRVANGDEQAQYRVPGALGLDPLLVGGTSLITPTTRGLSALRVRAGGAGWTASTEPRLIAASLALGPDGLVWAGTAEGMIHAWDAATGAERLRFDAAAPVTTTAAVALDGTAWFGAGSSVIGLRASEAAPRAVVRLGAAVLWVIVDGDGVVYAGGADGTLWALDTRRGEIRWSLRLSQRALRARAALGARKVLYVPCDDGRLYAVGEP